MALNDGQFVFLIDGQLQTVTDSDNIPATFAHVIKFAPVIEDGPHTDQQHEEIAAWITMFQALMDKERA